ncbi:VWA domain-containing protein [Lentzea sp. NPDC058436]|uniref:VWA domain-containing protein n=1 Tax=Lentzea sp. NPDC058436 TaxID=3346499 RepID=UPI0036524AAC
MTAHLVADPDVTGAAIFPARQDWLTLSAALADEVPVIADRDDLLVTIAPGAGGGAPACFYPARAVIEVDGDQLEVDPATVDPANLSDRARYPVTWGLLTHECAHAKHSVWELPDDVSPAVADAAMQLEESRMESAHIRRRPDDRHWLRASATSLVLADFAGGATMTRGSAARAAALVLARVDGGILTPDEAEPVANIIEEVLGTHTLTELRTLWQEALAAADDDADTMIDVGKRWCETVGAEPDSDTRESDERGEAGGSPSPLSEAISRALSEVASAVAREAPPADPAVTAAAAKAAEKAASGAVEKIARSVFSDRRPSSDHKTTTIAGTRKPTTAERNAARTLARALSTAGTPERVAVKSTSPIPPGRLRMRGALAADAQRAAGAVPTAEPFTRTTRVNVTTPPLRLGIACDVSGSMCFLRGPVASTAWILAHAGRHTTVPTETATVIFGTRVQPITRPGVAPTEVTEFRAKDFEERVTRAIDSLDGALGLSRPGAARLLVIVSDGRFNDSERDMGQKRVARLRASGCAVLWLTSHPSDTPFDGVTVHQLADPTATAQAIGRAATKALKAVVR